MAVCVLVCQKLFAHVSRLMYCLCCREKDLDEVLQTTAIFANVGKGVMAAKEDLQVKPGLLDADALPFL